MLLSRINAGCILVFCQALLLLVSYLPQTGAAVGSSCNATIDCATPTETCNDTANICVCAAGYIKNGQNECGPVVALGDACNSNHTCTSSNAYCFTSLNGSTCICTGGYYDDNGSNKAGGSCVQKVGLGYSCPQPDACVNGNATCGSDNICMCLSGFYDSNGGGQNGGDCQPKVGLGYSCPRPDACVNGNATCGSDNICMCLSGFYDSNGGGQNGGDCQPKVSLGSPCLQSDACETSSAYCGTSSQGDFNICVCSDNFYDSNGLLPQGECRDVTNLRVRLISYGLITMDTIYVSWTPPNDTTAVNYYLVEHMPADNGTAGSNQSVDINTSATLRSLESGRKYSIKVISINSQTALSQRATYVTVYQVSRPRIPGALTHTREIDAITGNITLYWTGSTGVVTGYNVSLENTTFRYYQTFSSSTTNPNHVFSKVKSGTWYTFAVQAFSGYFDTDTLYSDIYREQIKTKVQIPQPPSNPRCSNATDGSFHLTWVAPQEPNGDILYYIITVNRTNPSGNYYNITMERADVEVTVNNLTAGSFYDFKVYTMNEVYLSVEAALVTRCETRGEMAKEPRDLNIYNVTSHSGSCSWNTPSKLTGVHYGYSLQILNTSSGNCIKEVIFKCTSCLDNFPDLPIIGCLNNAVNFTTNLTIPQKYDVYNLLPDTNYKVVVSAITSAGRGYDAYGFLKTEETAPQMPYNITVESIQNTSATIRWNIGEPRPGNTTYDITLTADHPANNRTYTVSGFYTYSYKLTSLEEFWNYSVIVEASTSKGHSKSDSSQFRTKIGYPGNVTSFKVNTGNGADMFVTAKVSWQLPDILERNGKIENFIVSQEENVSGSFVQINGSNVMAAADPSFSYSILFPVKPDITYRFIVFAFNSLVGKPSTQEYIAPAGPPINNVERQGFQVIPVETFSSPSQTSFQIEINDTFFMDKRNGEIQWKGLICCKACKKANSTTMKPIEVAQIKTYTQAKMLGLDQYRLPVPPNNQTNGGSGARRKRDTLGLTVYQVGIESCARQDESYLCNGPLDPGTSYSIIAVVCTSGYCTLSNSYGPFITLAVPDNSTFPAGAVAGGIAGGVSAIIIIAVIFVLLRRRSKKLGKTRKRADDGSEPTDMDNLSKIRRRRPINLANFAEYIADYHKDSNLKFSEEYEDLKTLSPQHSHEAADIEENRLKNRFVNILPFDHSRVRLLPIDDVPGSDYINANYLPGFSKTREYIACQGPIPATIDDHWRLIWEQNVRVIVMLTQYKEENRVKCEPYMPLEVKDPKQYGDLVVECLTYSSMNSFEYRTLKIRLGEKERTIKHFHFLSWRDYSANVQFDTMIDFIKKVRSFIQPPDVEGPMIVHCSAGVGRTGTYITIDHVIQHIDKYGPDSTMDIFNFVLKLRENRTTMVQTEQQYIFIHDCIKEYLDRFKTYENQAFSSEEENLYQNSETIELYQNVNFNSTQKTEL